MEENNHRKIGIQKTRCILAVDVGTTNIKAALLEVGGRVLIQRVCKTPLTDRGIYVEGSALQLYEDLISLIEELVLESRKWESTGRGRYEIAAVCMASQMASLLCMDEHMEPIGNLIYGIDTRGSKYLKQLSQLWPAQSIYRSTGCPESGIYWPEKLLWLREHCPDILERACYLAGAKEYLLYRLTGQFLTDHASASATAVYHQEEGSWWSDMLAFLEVDERKLPGIRNPWEAVGKMKEAVSKRLGIKAVPVLVGSGDGPMATISSGAAAFGDCCISFGTTVAARLVTDSWQVENGGLFVQHLYDDVYLQGVRINDGGRVAGPYIEAAGGVEQPSLGAFWVEGKFYPDSPSSPGGRMTAVLNGVLFELYAALRPLVKEGRIKRILASGGESQNRAYMQRMADLFGVSVVIRGEEAAFAGMAALVSRYENPAEHLFDAVNRLAFMQECLLPEENGELLAQFQCYLEITGRKVGAGFNE